MGLLSQLFVLRQRFGDAIGESSTLQYSLDLLFFSGLQSFRFPVSRGSLSFTTHLERRPKLERWSPEI